MRRLLLALAVALAAAGGTARADTFRSVPNGRPLTLPSAEVPNASGSLLLPPAWTTTSSSPPQQLSLPQLQGLWQRAGAAYGIPWHVLAAINKIESNFGRNMGPSSAGAVGWMQFMPDTWLRWGMDGNGDRIADPWTAEDGVYSAARYLAAAGGRTDVPRAIFAYNHAQWYVDDVLELANVFAQGGPDAAFDLDQMQQQLVQAQVDVVETNEQLVEALRTERRLSRIEQRRRAEVERYELLSDRLTAEKRAVLATAARRDVSNLVAKLRGRLDAAEEALEAARSGSQGAAFGSGTGALLGAASFQDGYVFPVGGGPGAVSVSAGHHDYPAADIAAPAGSPLYALANGIVVRAWSAPDVRCGIGLTLRSADGLVWTYCHLAYLDPSVQEGVVLAAGAPVGLVGSTGRSTGPHLHLQLQPATAYPQQQAWFQAFAGRAFRWEGAAPPLVAPARNGPVFSTPPSGGSQGSGDVVAFTR